MIVAGLTGGIATGKSTVSNFLSDAGARIIDADKIAREVVEQETPAYDEIRASFGEEILMPNGDIDRERLGDIIFNDSDKKKRLDAIVHPRVFERSAVLIAEIAAREPDAVVFLDIPLLLEADMDRDLAEVIVVYVPEALQLQRLMARDGIDEKAAMARIRSQMPIEEKRKRATYVIDNSVSRAACRQQAIEILDLLRQKGN